MTGQQILDLIGYPVTSQGVRRFLSFYGIERLDDFRDSAWSQKDGISIEFTSRIYYTRKYGEQPHSDIDATHDDQERIAEEVTFESTFTGEWPMSLRFADGVAPFLKTGKRLTKDVEKETGRTIYRLLSDRHLIMVSVDKEDKIEFLRFWPIEQRIRKAADRKANIKQQDQNLLRDTTALATLTDAKPTYAWQQRMLDGDSTFTNSNISDTDTILDQYLAALITAAQEGKASKIFAAIKSVVLSLNKLNNKHHHIETLERGELCTYITQAAKATGYRIDDEEDVTEDWREW